MKRATRVEKTKDNNLFILNIELSFKCLTVSKILMDVHTDSPYLEITIIHKKAEGLFIVEDT